MSSQIARTDEQYDAATQLADDVSAPSGHDIIVIGGSAGALQPLQQILAGLSADLPAAIFIALHLGGSSHLTEVLAHRTALHVHTAASGAAIKRGHIYVAVPDHHLLLHDHHVMLRRGPRENLARPAIDPLFRSAAATFAARVIGVVLSGCLNDGTAGLRAIKQCGGLAMVQHPADAAYLDMPSSALRHVAVDHVVAADEMPALLSRLVGQPPGKTPRIPDDVRFETAIAAQELAGMEANQRLGQLSPFACPECHGVLWEIDDGEMLRYRCHVGHAFTAQTMQAEQDSRAEELLWNLLRTHEERAALTERMAAREHGTQHNQFASTLRLRAQGYKEDAEIIRRLLQNARAGQPAGGGEESP